MAFPRNAAMPIVRPLVIACVLWAVAVAVCLAEPHRAAEGAVQPAFPFTTPVPAPPPSGPQAKPAPLTPGAAPATGPGSLQGQVQAPPSGLQAPQPKVFVAPGGLPVTLIDVNTGRLIGRTYTDAAGHYSFPNVPAGTYKVIVGYPVPIQQQIISTPGGIDAQVPPIVVPGAQ